MNHISKLARLNPPKFMPAKVRKSADALNDRIAKAASRIDELDHRVQTIRSGIEANEVSAGDIADLLSALEGTTASRIAAYVSAVEAVEGQVALTKSDGWIDGIRKESERVLDAKEAREVEIDGKMDGMNPHAIAGAKTSDRAILDLRDQQAALGRLLNYRVENTPAHGVPLLVEIQNEIESLLKRLILAA